MTARVVLVRHGRSAHVHRGGWVDAAGVRRWRGSYDEAGIADDDGPPAALAAEAARAALVVASDLPRAVASAERLAAGRRAETTPLLRESELAIPAWLPLRWPLALWDAAIHVQWLWRIARGSDAPPANLERAAQAARWLAARTAEGATAVAVTHGVFRRLLARRLQTDGWDAEPGPRSYRTWSAWVFRR